MLGMQVLLSLCAFCTWPDLVTAPAILHCLFHRGLALASAKSRMGTWWVPGIPDLIHLLSCRAHV